MERKNPADILFSGAGEQGLKCSRRTQLDVDIFGVRQKTQEQVEALLKRKIIGAPFARIARGDDEWRALTTGQDRHLEFELIEHFAEVVESDLKKIGGLRHRNGKTEIGRRSDDADDLGRHFFGWWARCHCERCAGRRLFRQSELLKRTIYRGRNFFAWRSVNRAVRNAPASAQRISPKCRTRYSPSHRLRYCRCWYAASCAV